MYRMLLSFSPAAVLKMSFQRGHEMAYTYSLILFPAKSTYLWGDIYHIMSEHVQMSTATDSREAADKIAKTLVEERLAACVRVIGPVTSTYRWKGKVETTEEYLCLIKTRSALLKDVERMILHLHPYELPEIIALPIESGYPPYLEWLEDETIGEDELIEGNKS